VLANLLRDARELGAVVTKGDRSLRALGTALLQDSFTILALERTRAAGRRLHLIGINRVIRLTETALFGIEIGKGVRLGEGIYFVHTVGTVIGGDAVIGDRVVFMGNNTVGTARGDGYPVIEDDVVLGAGARVLGPIRVGAGSVVGANAVVLRDVPPRSLAVGIPAEVRPLARQ